MKLKDLKLIFMTLNCRFLKNNFLELQAKLNYGSFVLLKSKREFL